MLYIDGLQIREVERAVVNISADYRHNSASEWL